MLHLRGYNKLRFTNCHFMKPIIDRVDSALIERELKQGHFVRKTNNIGNEIYIFHGNDAPHAMQELGRLRELTFRQAGGGTGKEADIDKYDVGDGVFKQLIVWDPELKIIVGGYRFALGTELPKDENGKPISPTSHLFELSDYFLLHCLPKSIELGRSFVQPEYQSTGNAKKSIYALDNLWDGLGLLLVENNQMENFFGKITMYTHYPVAARDAILYFLKSFFPDNEGLIRPKQPLITQTPDEVFAAIFTGKTLEENYKILINTVRNHQTAIPPLVNAYIKLSPTMKTFGTAINYNFGEVEETGILIKIADIYESKKNRYVTNIQRHT